MNRYAREVRDSEYVQRVRKHPPSSLIPLIAAASARYQIGEWEKSPGRRYTPWALADLARVSMMYGSEYRSARATENDLLSCLCAYSALGDPELTDGSDPSELFRCFLRLSAEQLPFQHRPFNALARSIALFEQTTPARELQVIRPGWDTDLFGATLEDYVRTALLIQAGAWRNNGTFRRDWLDQENFTEILQGLPKEVILDVLDKQFCIDAAAFRTRQQRAGVPQGEYRRFGFNPLWSAPVIEGFGDALLVPVIDLLPLKVGPLGVYYSGVQRHGSAFAQDLGQLTEDYVGRQLRSLGSPHVVHPSVKAKHGKHDLACVDWLVVTPTVTVLVEVKSVRPTEPVRLGTPEAVSELERMLERAHQQVAESAQLIQDRHPAFSHVPDQPIVGLVVTLEPIENVNDPLRDVEFTSTGIPTTICSVEDIEHLVAVDPDPFGLLTEQFQRTGVLNVGAVLTGREVPHNQILTDAFDSYRWLRVHPDEGAEASKTAGRRR